MQLKTGRWLRKNGLYIQLLGIASMATGVLVSGISMFSPAFFIAVTQLPPLTFLATMNFPLALVILGVVSAGSAFIGIIASFMLTKQIISIAQHVAALLLPDNADANLTHHNDSTSFIHKHLRGNSAFSDDHTSVDSWEQELCLHLRTEERSRPPLPESAQPKQPLHPPNDNQETYKRRR